MPIGHTTPAEGTTTPPTPSASRKRYIVDDIDIKDIENTMGDFQDCAMVLSQQIESLLSPKNGADSPHFSAWRLCQMLTAHLESGHMQHSVKDYLTAEAIAA